MKELFSTSEEWHAFLIGFFEVLCPWPPNRCHCERSEAISNEHHYYLGGRAAAVLAWIAIAKLIHMLFW